MPVVARTRFLVGRHWCEVRTYEIYGSRREVLARFSIGSVEGLDIGSAERCIDAIRKVRSEVNRRMAGRSNTGQSPMGGNFQPVQDPAA